MDNIKFWNPFVNNKAFLNIVVDYEVMKLLVIPIIF